MSIISVFRTVSSTKIEGLDFPLPTYRATNFEFDMLHTLLAAGADDESLPKGQETHIYSRDNVPAHEWEEIQSFLPNLGLEPNSNLVIRIKDDGKSFVKYNRASVYGCGVLKTGLVALDNVS